MNEHHASLRMFLSTATEHSPMMTRAALILAALFASACARQTPSGPPSPVRSGEPAAARGADSAGGGAASRTPSPRPYGRVITSQAQTRRGMFAVHRVDDKLFFEIPRKELNKDMLLVGRYARAAASQPNTPGQFGTFVGDQFGERTLRWERNGNRIILRSPAFDITADSSLSVWRAVEASNYAPIIAVLNVEAFGPDSADRKSVG